MRKQNINYLITLLIVVGLAGCATAPYETPIQPPARISGTPGTYHKVEKGQTLWAISKIYNVDLDELVNINRIGDDTKIEIGQLIFIPQKQKIQYIPSKYSGEDFIWPLKGRVISGFGQTFDNIINKGINIQPYGSKEVLACRSGRVIFYSDNFKGYGKTIIIEHPDGFLSVYSRNSKVYIKPGDRVEKGNPIAEAGSYGRDKNTYLHFEIRKGYAPKNPIFYLP